MKEQSIDFVKINADLKNKHPQDIIHWSIGLKRRTILTTNFGPHESAIIFATQKLAKDIPIVWVDSGYNTLDTYKMAHQLKSDWKLNLHIYTPRISAAYRNGVLGGIPLLENEEKHQEFTEEVKLEPFSRALKEHRPEVWLTALRREQTPHRESLDIVVTEQNGILKVSPFFFWKENEVVDYINENNLPINNDYFDPTKVLGKRECGLHLANKN